MAKGGMPDVVAQGDSLSEVFVQVEGACDSPRYLRHLKCVSQTCDIVVTCRCYEHLGLVLEAPE